MFSVLCVKIKMCFIELSFYCLRLGKFGLKKLPELLLDRRPSERKKGDEAKFQCFPSCCWIEQNDTIINYA